MTTVRLRTSLTLRLIVSEKVPFFRRRMFSRIRSKTTTVSVREYPPTVSSAVMKRRSFSIPKIQKIPTSAKMSWKVATAAATPNLNSNRHAR